MTQEKSFDDLKAENVILRRENKELRERLACVARVVAPDACVHDAAVTMPVGADTPLGQEYWTVFKHPFPSKHKDRHDPAQEPPTR